MWHSRNSAQFEAAFTWCYRFHGGVNGWCALQCLLDWNCHHCLRNWNNHRTCQIFLYKYKITPLHHLPLSNPHLLSLTYGTLWKFEKIQYCDNFFVHFKSGFELRREALVKIEIEFRLMASLWMVLHQQAISLKANIDGIWHCTQSVAIRSALVCLAQKLFRLFALLILSQMFRSLMQTSPASQSIGEIVGDGSEYSLVEWHGVSLLQFAD